MCALASDFSGVKLDEETEPNKRLDQILDERGVTGDFRPLLTEHFANNNPPAWQNFDKLDQALSKLNFNSDEQQLISAFWVSLVTHLTLALDVNIIMAPEELNAKTVPLSGHFQLALEIKDKYYSDSPVDLFKSDIGQTLSFNRGFGFFALLMYGREYLYTEQFFNESALAESQYLNRVDFLKIVLNDLLPEGFSLGNNQPSSNIDSLYSFLKTSRCLNTQHVPNSSELPFLNGLKFLESWIISDAKSGRISHSNDELLFQSKDWIRNLITIIQDRNGSRLEPGSAINEANVLAKNLTSHFDFLYFSNASMSNETNSSESEWARGIDTLHLTYFHLDLNTEKNEFFYYFQQEECRTEFLASKLDADRLDTWIKWTVIDDMETMVTPITESFGKNFYRTSKWLNSKYSSKCMKIFENQITKKETGTRLQILSNRIPRLPKPYLTEANQWWSGLLKELVEEEDFPRDLIPNWTAAAIDKSLSHEELLPYFDKGIGMLRNSASTDWDAEKNQLLQKLIEALTVTHPEKALKHRLLILRAINVPVTDSTLSLYRSPDSTHTVGWYRPLRDIGQAWVSHSTRSKPFTSNENRDQAYAKHLLPFNLQVAEFCLTRLRLRKKEKAVNGKYESHQVVESSSIWREAYIKVLQELGLDLNGRVHKTLHFIKSADPDPNVRNSAMECYKAVRKNNGKTTIIELRRGLVAADWWLHLCQRQHLKVEIQTDEAIQTRRRLMRNP